MEPVIAGSLPGCSAGLSRIHRLMATHSGPGITQAIPVTELAIDGLGKRYGETIALHDATLTFRPGTIHTILGENGSGKSTMLKILSGVIAPSEGRVTLNGSPVAAASPHDMHQLGLATVFQEVLVAPNRSVTENIFLGYDGFWRRRIDRSRRAAAAAAVLQTIARFPIDPQALVGSLPLAVQQLVVIARALVRLPSILLLDEATAALDYADRDHIFETIEEYARAGNIVLFISHRMEEVKRLSDQVTVLRSGQVVETLAREEISSQRLLQLMAPEANIHGE
jgi:ribose transport system ATP-binding protein